MLGVEALGEAGPVGVAFAADGADALDDLFAVGMVDDVERARAGAAERAWLAPPPSTAEYIHHPAPLFPPQQLRGNQHENQPSRANSVVPTPMIGIVVFAAKTFQKTRRLRLPANGDEHVAAEPKRLPLADDGEPSSGEELLPGKSGVET